MVGRVLRRISSRLQGSYLRGEGCSLLEQSKINLPRLTVGFDGWEGAEGLLLEKKTL